MLLKLIQIIFPAFMIVMLVQSCREDSPLEKGLIFAGENRGELEKVIDYYSKDPRDSLRLKAAKFLIANMPYHFGYYDKTKKTPNLFSVIDTQIVIHGSLSTSQKGHIADSLSNIYGLESIESREKIYDSKILNADFLINNINYSFLAWESASWKKKVSFDDFCEYILPYRIREESAEYWRPAYHQRYLKTLSALGKDADAKSAFDHMNWLLNTETNFTVYFNKYYPFVQSLGDAEKGKVGGCETTAFIAANGMRSIGIPAAYDYIMHWGSSNSRHYMPQLVGDFKKQQLLTNANKQESTWHLVDFSTEFNSNRHKFLSEEIPTGLYIQNVRTIPKVYRYTYSQSKFLTEINSSVKEEFISPEFRKTNIKDVTQEYLTTTNISIPVNKTYNQYQVAYLCVFDVSGWKPIAINKLEKGRVLFKKIGKEVMYLPTIYHSGAHWSVGKPFYIDSLNKIHQVQDVLSATSPMTILRKFPLYTYSAYHSEILKGGRFEASDNEQFSTPVVLHEIKDYPFSVITVEIKEKRKFRYFRYVAPSGADFEADNIAEIVFLDPKGLKILGRHIGVPGTEAHEINKAFDDDLNTYYENSRIRDGWLGIDLGAKKESGISKILYCPRSDTNFIMPGNQYELFYWTKGGWVSLGDRIADDYRLEYADAPKNGLFWLRCQSGGSEERIFTYQNGKQIWW